MVPPELRAAARHSLCCNGRTRQRFSSALCGGRSPAHGRLLAARPSGRQPSLRHGERDFGLSASSFLHRMKLQMIVARGAEKIKGCACRNLDWTILALLGEIWYRIDAASGGKALTTNTGGCPLPVPECRVRRFSWRFALPRRLRAERGDKTMSILEFTALLSLLGGAIYVTFQITWTVSHSDDKNKKNDRL